MHCTAVAAITLTVTVSLLGGCGQMGPLYMPTEEEKLSKPAEQTSQTQQKTSTPVGQGLGAFDDISRLDIRQ